MPRTFFDALRLALVAATLLAAGCAHVDPAVPDEKTALAERARAFHQARVEGRWDEAYEYFYSGYRDQRSKSAFLSIPKNVNVLGFEIGEIRIDDSGKTAEVPVKEKVSIQGYEFEGGFTSRNWVKEKGNWYLQFDPQSPAEP
ncbi:MAG: hypothetical protein ACLFPR_07080 [Desulfococcaceae bacterium]